MPENHTYAVTEIVGTSTESIDDAISSAVDQANKTLRHLDWFEVTKITGHISDGKVGHVQVMMKIGFRYE